MAIFLASLAGIAFLVVNLIVDPYGEFNFFPNAKYEDDHYSGAYVAYAQLEKQGPLDLVFGTSNSATLDQDMLGAPLFNLSDSVWGRPECVRDFLAGLDETQWQHVGRIFYLVDLAAMGPAPEDYAGCDFHSLSGRILRSIQNFDSKKVFLTLENISKNIRGNAAYRVRADLSMEHVFPRPFDPNFDVFHGAAHRMTYSQQQSDALVQIRNLVHSKGHSIVFFKAVMHDSFWCNVEPDSIPLHYRCLVRAIPDLVCMEHIDAFSKNSANFRDLTHQNNNVTSWEAGILLDPKKAKAYRVGPDNVEAHIKSLLALTARCRDGWPIDEARPATMAPAP